MEKYYGNIDVLMNNNSISKHLYELAHIPGAYFFDISVAMYPGVEERFSFYPVNIFQEYIRKIGINNNDHLILYSRGSMGGNMFAARCFYLLEMYGFKSMSLLSGGFNKWMKDGFIEDEGFEDYMGEGDFVGERDFEMTVSYDELTTKNNEGKDMFDRAGDDVTFIDARPFTDYQKSHIINAVNLPVIETINDDGTIKEANEILQIAEINNVTFTQPIVVYCNTGTQASLLAFIIENVIGMKVRLYNGGFTELKVKDSSRFT
uniref:Sulfurtransferase n=1 Tax=Parastrongyloides trichosuri TaxID=131310 RepID=A0A0N4ZN17_PARTI